MNKRGRKNKHDSVTSSGEVQIVYRTKKLLQGFLLKVYIKFWFCFHRGIKIRDIQKVVKTLKTGFILIHGIYPYYKILKFNFELFSIISQKLLDMRGFLLGTFQNFLCGRKRLVSARSSGLSDCNWTRTQNHLVRLASLAKWLSVCLRTKWFWVPVQLQSLKLQISRLLRARSSLTFRELESVDSL